MPHTDFVAIVKERNAWHRKAEGIDNLQFFICTFVAKTGIVVIPHRQTDIALANGLLILVHITFQEGPDFALTLSIEIAVPSAHTVEYAPILLLKEVVVAVEPVEEVNVEAVVECISGKRPLGHHKAARIFLFQQLTNLAPEELGFVLVGIIELFIASHATGLHQSPSHISTETVGTHIHPKAQHILQVLTHRHHIWMIRGQLPLLFRIGIGKAEIEGWLTPVEVTHKLTVALAVALHKLACKLHWGIHPVGLSPDVIVGVFVFLLLLRGHKPRMIDSSVANHVVENDVHATLMSLLKEPFGIVVGTIAGGDFVIVADVIARIVERRVEERVEPDGIHTEALHVIELADDTLQISDTITVGVAERLRINLVEYGILGPVGHRRNLILSCNGLGRRDKSASHQPYC